MKAKGWWSWDPYADQWEEGFSCLLKYVESGGNARVPKDYKVDDDGFPLGQWIAVQRRNKKLDPDRKDRLSKVPGWSQDIVTDQWEEGFSQLQKYAEDNGHTHRPKSNWVAKQRQDYAKGRLDPDRKDRLSKLPGWSWDPYTDQWEESFGQLVKFAEDSGHARVPSTHKLAGWVKKQRTACAQGKLDADRKDRLSNVKGWSWDPDGDRWEQGLNRLLAYIKEFGHSLVPPGYKTADDGFGLGQ